MLGIARQQGLSMVELLVALAISSFLILGITQIYLDSKRNDVFRQSQAANLENSRFALSILNELISKAGYRRSPEQSMLAAFPENNNALTLHCDSFAAAAVVTKLKSATGAQVGFCLRYQPAFNGEYICDGSTASLENNAPMMRPALSETIYVAIKFIPDKTSLHKGSLKCIAAGTRTSLVQLMEGIADMQVEFGLGDAADSLVSQDADKKLRANNPFVKADAWNQDGIVRVVRYSILLASRSNQRDSNDSKIFTNWLAAINDSNNKERLEIADQRRIYQQVSSTQTLRNMLP